MASPPVTSYRASHTACGWIWPSTLRYCSGYSRRHASICCHHSGWRFSLTFSNSTCSTARQSPTMGTWGTTFLRSEEHTSELQSRENLVCRLLLEKKKKKQDN